MPRKQVDVEKSLEAKGFQRPRGGDHNYFHYHSVVGKKTAVFTKTSHGAREIDDGLLARYGQAVQADACRFRPVDRLPS